MNVTQSILESLKNIALRIVYDTEMQDLYKARIIFSQGESYEQDALNIFFRCKIDTQKGNVGLSKEIDGGFYGIYARYLPNEDSVYISSIDYGDYTIKN